MRPEPARSVSGAQRLVWLLPAAFLAGVSDTGPATAAVAAALLGVAWQLLCRRPLLARIAAIVSCWCAVEVLVLLGLAGAPGPGTVAAIGVAMSGASVGTEWMWRIAEQARARRDGWTVPAGT